MPHINNIISPIKNPFSGAFCVGVIGAALTCIGASIREHHLRHEALSVLVGGCLTGIAASFLSMLLLEHFALKLCENHSLQSKLVSGVFFLIANLVAPIVGNIVLEKTPSWSQIIVDEMIGACIAGTLCLGALKTAQGLQSKSPPISPEFKSTSIETMPSKKLESIEEFDDLETRSACSVY